MKNTNAIQARVKSAIFTLCIALSLLFFLLYVKFSLPDEPAEKYFIVLNFQDETQRQQRVNQSQIKKDQAPTDKILLKESVKEGSLIKQDQKKRPATGKNPTKEKVLIVLPKNKKPYLKTSGKEAPRHVPKKSKNTYKVKRVSSQKKSTSSPR